MKTIYNKTQYGILIYIMVIVMVFLSYAYFYQTGSNPIPLIPYVILMMVFLVIILFFYKLTIIIDDEKITAIFGIGFLKKSIYLNEIDTIETYKAPWFTGIGVRLTSKGWLWNVKVGNAILLNDKNKTKTFLVGTDDADKIVNLLKQLQ